jgi:hypothetical protein
MNFFSKGFPLLFPLPLLIKTSQPQPQKHKKERKRERNIDFIEKFKKKQNINNNK